MPAAFRKISGRQMRALWACARDWGYDSDELHRIVHGLTGSKSISALTAGQAKIVLDQLIPKRKTPRPAEARPGMATKKQTRMIQGLWSALGEMRWYTPKNRNSALREFLSKRFGVSDIRFLTVAKARSVIEALKNILKEQGK